MQSLIASKTPTMEKTPMYAVVTPPRPQRYKSRIVMWLALFLSVTGLVIAGVTSFLEKRQTDRVNALEETVLQMQIHMEQILQFSHDYLEYEEDDLDDPQGGMYEELTVRGVVRKKRQAPAEDRRDGVPIYDQAYGVDLRSHHDGLRLYESFDTQGTRGEEATRGEFEVESTESPIKPHHRVSNLWVPKKRRQRYPSSASGPELFSRARVVSQEGSDEDFEEDAVFLSDSRRKTPVLQRRSRVKSLSGVGGGIRRRQKSRDHSNQNPVNVLFRDSFVKTTAREERERSSALNSVVPQTQTIPEAPTVVDQRPRQRKQKIVDDLVAPYLKRKKKAGRKHARRGGHRRARSIVTLGHFVAAPANRTTHHVTGGEVHDEWMPAAWMDKLGLNKKYALRRGAVTVKESGLYYLYAQVLYEPGRFGTGYQIMVDGIPVMECTMMPSQPSHSCHTSGTTYLQRNAAVSIRDIESHMTTVRREANSFFGLVKLMNAPESAEKLILG